MSKSLFIHGDWQAGQGDSFNSLNPATGASIWTGRAASPAQVNAAVGTARSAFASWADQSFEQRCEQLRRYAEQLSQHKESLAQCIAEESGKPLWEAHTEVTASIAKIEISIKAARERTGERCSEINGAKAVLRHKPHGVVAVFGPYNFPVHLPNGHIVPALLAGNTVVFKPSELTPKVAELTVTLWQQASLPAGVINLVQGAKETGIALAANPDIDGLFFTGSSTVGQLLHQQFAGRPEIILALEMGGNNPLIIDQISNIEAAVYETIQSAFITSGQRCTCARRLFIPRNPTGDQYLAQLLTAASQIKVGEQFDQPAPFMGSLISEQAADKIIEAEQQLLKMGATALLPLQKLKSGTGLLTAGLIDVTHLQTLPDEEHFGPLLKVIRYNDFTDAVQQANHTKFGLAAGLFSDNPQQFEYFRHHIRAGIVNWNKPLTGASSTSPFGGIGASGNHRASAYYAADYCAYPVAGIESEKLTLPDTLLPGI